MRAPLHILLAFRYLLWTFTLTINYQVSDLIKRGLPISRSNAPKSELIAQKCAVLCEEVRK